MAFDDQRVCVLRGVAELVLIRNVPVKKDPLQDAGRSYSDNTDRAMFDERNSYLPDSLVCRCALDQHDIVAADAGLGINCLPVPLGVPGPCNCCIAGISAGKPDNKDLGRCCRVHIVAHRRELAEDSILCPRGRQDSPRRMNRSGVLQRPKQPGQVPMPC